MFLQPTETLFRRGLSRLRHMGRLILPSPSMGGLLVLVQGLSRSGTSALLYRIANSLPPDDTRILFEPLCFCRSRTKNVVAKVLLDGHLWNLDYKLGHVIEPANVDPGSYVGYNKHVAIVRDPRDRLISQLLYGFFHEPYCRDDLFVESAVRMLRQKEAEPDSISVRDLMTFITEYRTFAGKRTLRPPRSDDKPANPDHVLDNPHEDNLRRHPEVFVVHYEDMIAGNLGPLEEFLGIPLWGSAEVAPVVRRVERSKASGNYKNWFTEDDAVYYERLFAPNIRCFSRYGDRTLNPTKKIRPQYASEYVLRIANEARAGLHLPRIVV